MPLLGRLLALALLAAPLAACTRPPPPRAPEADVARRFYLPPSQAGGSPFCFDPESAALRAALTRKPFEENDPLDAAALAADVGDLHAAMKKLYAGYPELIEARDFDVDRFFDDWQRTVRARGGTISFSEGIVGPLVALRHHIRDGHLFVNGWVLRLADDPRLTFSEYQANGHVADFDDGRCTFEGASPIRGTGRFVKLLTRAGVEELSTFSAQSVAPSVDVRCGERATRFTRRPRRDRRADPKAPVYEWHTTAEATVIVVRHLTGSPADLALLERLAADYREHAKKPNVVFDLRGNGGGNDGYVFDWVERAVRGSRPAPLVQLEITSATACGSWNNLIADQAAYDRVGAADARAERDALVRDRPLGGRAGEPAQVVNGTLMELEAKEPYVGRVFVVVDRASASSAEGAASLLRITMNATVVGERTLGLNEFGNIRPYVMPRTGVVWRLASTRRFFDGPRDGVGVPVDVVLDGDLVEAPIDELVPRLVPLPKGP